MQLSRSNCVCGYGIRENQGNNSVIVVKASMKSLELLLITHLTVGRLNRLTNND